MASDLEISCAFATATDTPEHVRLAEQLGYRRAWLYDSPALLPEAFMTLGRCAERTDRIGLGTGVLIPSLRHPMTAAAAIATLVELAPGRVEVGVGSGFTGRSMLGKRALPWSTVADYIRCVQTLLRGERTEWDGAVVQMMQPPGFGAARPISVPWIVACEGPKGQAVARELGDGVFSPFPLGGFDRSVQLLFGTVLDDGETPDSERVMAAAGHAVAVGLHRTYEQGNARDPDWVATVDALPESVRHIALHDRHLISVTDRDRPFITGDMIARRTCTGSPDDVRTRIAAARDAGVTEIAYQPAGPDIPRELRAFMDTVKDLGSVS